MSERTADMVVVDTRNRRMLRLLSDFDHLDKLPDDHAQAVRWARDHAETIVANRDELQHQIEELEVERDNLKEALKDTKEEVERLEKENAELASERDCCKSENESNCSVFSDRIVWLKKKLLGFGLDTDAHGGIDAMMTAEDGLTR